MQVPVDRNAHAAEPSSTSSAARGLVAVLALTGSWTVLKQLVASFAPVARRSSLTEPSADPDQRCNAEIRGHDTFPRALPQSLTRRDKTD